MLPLQWFFSIGKWMRVKNRNNNGINANGKERERRQSRQIS